MKLSIYVLVIALCPALVVACGTGIRNSDNNDASRVTIRSSAFASMDDRQVEANKYCTRYGRRAYFVARYDQQTTVYDCR